jgi:hypothetical protein
MLCIDHVAVLSSSLLKTSSQIIPNEQIQLATLHHKETLRLGLVILNSHRHSLPG